MENYQGDLTDIVRASGGQIGCNNSASHVNSSPATWQFPNSDDPLTLCSFIDHIDDDNLFGDPFSNIQDPLLNRPSSSNSCYYNPPNISLGYHEDAAPCDSPVMAAASPRGIINAPAASDMINANSSLTSCLVDNTGPGQISSPRNLGIKRRKSLTKKVVCIPAPAAANSRSSGEVVPSDLWAWRKYGQKPIKGSPYPRGYYRCSSSKGCSARKQVERSRTDPNMLVITYTSEHNHPWPTQRNALAGSTRSQPSKANACASASKGSASPTSHRNTANNNIKEEVKDSSNNDDDTMSPSNNIAAPISSNAASCEEENIEEPIGNQMEIADDEFNEGLCSSQIYKPEMPDSNQLYHEDFFAELGEIDADPFNIFDWSSDNNNNNNSNSNNTSFGEIKRG